MAVIRCVVIANPAAGSASELAAIEEKLRTTPRVEVWRTERPGHAMELAVRAAGEKADMVVAAGGDGTIHEVVNGLAPRFSDVVFGVIPLGTGNDLVRTLGVPRDPLEASEALLEGPERRLDLIDVELENGRRCFAVNAVTGGFSGHVTEALTSDLKARFGSLAFLIGAGEAVRTAASYETELELDGEVIEEPSTLGVLVANGRTAAGGIEIAPGASPEDGLLEVLLLRHGTALELASLAARLLTGGILESDSTVYRPSTEIRVSSSPPMPFTADGELLPAPPRWMRVAPRLLRVRAGRNP